MYTYVYYIYIYTHLYNVYLSINPCREVDKARGVIAEQSFRWALNSQVSHHYNIYITVKLGIRIYFSFRNIYKCRCYFL